MKRKKFFLMTAVCVLSFLAFLGTTNTSVSAKSHYKIEKITKIKNPQRYWVKGTIWNEKFTKKVTSKDRHKSTYFGTLYKATVKTPAGKKAIYYGVGAMIPGMTISEPRLAGWTWHKHLYHKVSQSQPKKDIAFMKSAISLLRTEKDRQQALSELSKVEPGTAYSNYGWPSHWMALTESNLEKSMADNDFIALGDVVTDALNNSEQIDSNDEDGDTSDPVENVKFVLRVYEYFRPRFAKEVPSMKAYDKEYNRLKSLSKMSESEYVNHELHHVMGPSLDTSGSAYSGQLAGEISNLITGLNRSNQSLKKDTNFSTY